MRRRPPGTRPTATTGQICMPGRWLPPVTVAENAATRTSPIRPSTRSISTTAVASVFEPAGTRRVADPDHVAADVARQEVVEEQRDQQRSEQRAAADVHALRVEQQLPSPGARQHVDHVDGQRHQQPRQRRLACARPQRADVDARKQQPQQADADADLGDQEQVAARRGCAVAPRTWSQKGRRDTVLRFRAKITGSCAF